MDENTSTFEKEKKDYSGMGSRLFGISTRSILVLFVVATVCYMSLRALKIEEPLYTLATVMVGYYFGQNQKNVTSNGK